MHDRLPVMIGIDGGATYSYGIAVDSNARVLAFAQSGSLSFLGSSMVEARRNLNQLVKALELKLPLQNEFASVVIGCAALFAEATETQKELLCKGILPVFRTRLVSDCLTAFHGATLGGPGVLVTGGTGSITVAQNEAGEFSQVGGWGHILGDAGGAYWIALESAKAAIAAVEGLGPQTSLIDLVCRWFEVKDLTDIVPVFYGSKFSKDKFAALAGFLSAEGGEDAVFQQICQRAGRELARQAQTALQLCGLKIRPAPLFLNGSVVTKNGLVRESLLKHLNQAYPIQLCQAQLPPVLGAAALAMGSRGLEVTPQFVKNLLESSQRLAQPAPKTT